MFCAVHSEEIYLLEFVKRKGKETMTQLREKIAYGLGIAALGIVAFTNRRRSSILRTASPKNVVFITGCDSGLGYNLAVYCHSNNMTVITGCMNRSSEGITNLLANCDPERLIPIEIDLRKNQSINDARNFIQKLLTVNPDYSFTALINNAGVMCFGEFEWQTSKIFENQIEVNLLGPMRLTREFLPLLRKYSGRIINVTSHCGFEALPGLAPYGASKSALKSWNDAIRIELKKYNVNVINFVPGSFIMNSNITAEQKNYAKEMLDSFDDEQRQFYAQYFHEYHEYLNSFCGPKNATIIDNKNLFEKFQHALLAEVPHTIYMIEPFRYKFYHFMFKWAPQPLKDRLILRFINMPEYKID